MPEIIKNICTDEMLGRIIIKGDSEVCVDMELTLTEPMADTDVIKLFLYSSGSGWQRINCGTAELSDGKFCLTKSFLNNPDIDTAEIIRKNVFTEDSYSLARVSFAESAEEDNSECDIEAIREKLNYLSENPAYKAYLSVAEDLKSPVAAAAEALDKLQVVLARMNEEGAHKRCIEVIRTAASKYETVADMPSEFEWHRITDFDAMAGITSFEHILYTPDVMNLFNTYGYYLLGLNENIACIAVPVSGDTPNPISHVDDCTVYIRVSESDLEYCTVCVAFEPDGQYFMPIC